MLDFSLVAANLTEALVHRLVPRNAPATVMSGTCAGSSVRAVRPTTPSPLPIGAVRRAGGLDRQEPPPVAVDLEHLVDERAQLHLEIDLALGRLAAGVDPHGEDARGAL